MSYAIDAEWDLDVPVFDESKTPFEFTPEIGGLKDSQVRSVGANDPFGVDNAECPVGNDQSFVDDAVRSAYARKMAEAMRATKVA